MIKSISKWLLRSLFANAQVRKLFEEELSKTHPILSHPQIKFAPPGHFYSPLPDTSLLNDKRELERLYAPPSAPDGVDLNTEAQLQLLQRLAPLAGQFDWPQDQAPNRRYWVQNGFFGRGDAVVLFAMIRQFNPVRIIEIGSGFSSALMLDTNDRYCNSQMHLTFIEPFPDRLNSLLSTSEKKSINLIVSPVQKVPPEIFDTLEANDILFIDSSHVSKLGSDLNHLLFSVVPRLRRGVIVHFHDINYPFEYSEGWLKNGRAWNEIYILRSFLQYNSDFEVLFHASYLAYTNGAVMDSLIPRMQNDPGASIWLRRKTA